MGGGGVAGVSDEIAPLRAEWNPQRPFNLTLNAAILFEIYPEWERRCLEGCHAAPPSPRPHYSGTTLTTE